MNSRRHHTVSVWLLTALMVFVLAHCDESLPPRNDPEEILRASVSPTGNRVVVREQVAQSGGNFTVRVENLHDEVLSDQALVRAEVRIEKRGDPSMSRTLFYEEGDLLNPSIVVGNTLTLPVHQAVVLMQPWDQRTDSGTPFWDNLPLFARVSLSGEGYWETDTLRVVVSVKVQVFNRVQALRPPPLDVGLVYELWRHPAPN